MFFLSFSAAAEKNPAFFKEFMYLRCRFVWQQHCLCLCFCRVMCFKWSLVLRNAKPRAAAKERSTNNSMFRCDAYKIEKTRTRTRTFCVCRLRRVRMCVCVCVCVCVVVFGGSKKDSKLALKRTSLFSFSTRRALLSTSLLRLCISTTP